jgi:hypothetical protein
MLTTIGLMTTIAGIYGGLGVVGHKYLTTGLSEGEVYGLYGDWFTGYADGVSGGLSSDVRSLTTGQPVTAGNQGWMWRMGQVAGIGTMMVVGMKSPQWATGQMGPLKLIALLEMGSQAYGFGKALGNFGMGLQDGWSQEDSWNLVSLLLGGISVAGMGKTLAAAKATSRATRAGNAASGAGSAVDDAVRNAGNTTTRVQGKCFVAGTEILTTEGEKNIEDIQVGDWVIADDPTTPGEIEARQVLETFVRHTNQLVDLYIDGEIISTTGEHPFWTPDKGWVEAKDLEVGSLVQTQDGRVIDVDRVEKREGDFTVYNFNVEGFHTYYVSNLGILVHNADYTTIYKAPQRGMGKKLLKEGFHPEDFSDPGGDNLSYFAKEKELADIYAKHYGEGILEVDIPKDIYDLRMANSRMKCNTRSKSLLASDRVSVPEVLPGLLLPEHRGF